MAEYESIAESAPHPQPLWRTAYLHMNALLPAAIVFVCLYFWSSVVLAIFLFHGVCLVLFPLLLIALSPRCGRTLEWYYAHIRQKIAPENWREQLPFAVLVMLGVTAAGFVGFVIEEMMLDLIPSAEATDKAQANGLARPVRDRFCSCILTVHTLLTLTP